MSRDVLVESSTSSCRPRRGRTSTLSVKMKSASDAAKEPVLVFEDIALENKILDIKRRICDSCNVPVHHQRLFKSGISNESTEISDTMSLADAKVELGWRNRQFTVPGDILELRTEMQMSEYYPGGRHWCQSWPVTSISQRESRMSLLLLIFLGSALFFSLLLSTLTS